MSIHIQPSGAAIADKVLLPGDPLRAKYIAETFLENAVCYNQVRGMLGYTGSYHGKTVSIQGTGMGMPSLGTCGAIREGVNIKDVVIATAASTDSNMNHDRFGSISFAPTADFRLAAEAAELAAVRGITAHTGGVYTSDKFYDDRNDTKLKLMHDYGVLAVDMETCELYTLAAKYGVRALTIMTVSDSFVTHEVCSAEERQTAFNDMIQLALEIV